MALHHSFDCEHAKQYGIVEAVLIANFQFWIAKNKANCENLRDGRTWTYNTVRAWSELFPYLSYNQVRRAIEKLAAAGVLVVGNYNDRGMDQTKWYAFADEKLFLPDVDHLANLPNAIGKSANPFGKSAKSLIRTDVVTTDERDRASRLSQDWKVPDDWKAVALEMRPEFTPAFIDEIGERFRKHWGRAAKSNWKAAWEKWVGEERRSPGAGGAPVDWRLSATGIEKRGEELGVFKGAGESFPDYRIRVMTADAATGVECPA